jgi:hypothetical protein
MLLVSEKNLKLQWRQLVQIFVRNIYSAFGIEVLTVMRMDISIFWDIICCRLMKSQRTFRKNIKPSSRSKSHPSEQSTLFAACIFLVSCLAYTSTLKMEVTCSSETSTYFYKATQHHIQKIILINIRVYFIFILLSTYVASILEYLNYAGRK